MKKSLGAAAVLVAAVITAGGAAVGCTPKKVNDLNTLNVVCLAKGYGSEWIETLADRYEAEHEGIKVNLLADARADQTIANHLSSKNNIDDLYISVGSKWKSYAAEGKFAELDDILDDPVDGVPLKEKINPEYSSSIYYTDKANETHTYRLPWTAGIGGIYYNQKLFDKWGWEVPNTYAELVELSNKIVQEARPVTENSRDVVKPFIYTSDNTDYFDYAVFNWWGQLAGRDAIVEFLKYDSADNFDTAKNPTYAKLKTATSMWQNLFASKSNYVMGTDKDHTQQTFTTGAAAMMFNAEWLYNETLTYNNGAEYANFELALMPTPTADNAIDETISYIVGEDQFIAVPESSIKKDLAKDFIKLIASDFGCKTFLQQANGMLAYRCDFAESDALNTFTKSLVSYRNGKDTFFTNFSPSQMYLKNKVDIWAKGGFRPYQKILQGTPLDGAFQTIASEAARQWGDWQ